MTIIWQPSPIRQTIQRQYVRGFGVQGNGSVAAHWEGMRIRVKDCSTVDWRIDVVPAFYSWHAGAWSIEAIFDRTTSFITWDPGTPVTSGWVWSVELLPDPEGVWIMCEPGLCGGDAVFLELPERPSSVDYWLPKDAISP